ncbi:hypothetical protein ABU614_09180 [Lysobacter firmicutimachus]|uniref:DUF982 domain-containing protein n=1 Tax=Lysobacter firmicutimachus TaxID=1792846 RepID=A0AAU8MZB6_9GAMM
MTMPYLLPQIAIGPIDSIDLDAELGHWRRHSEQLPLREARAFEDVEAAVKLGLDACLRSGGRAPAELHDELHARYRRLSGASPVPWDEAYAIALAAWQRASRRAREEAFDPRSG